MYAYIKGILAEVNTDSIVIENQGIGHQLYVSLQALEELPAIGMEVKVYTYLHVREDAMVLFGFPDREDLKMFQMLLTVSGVGPKGALGILSALSGDDLRFAILSGDSITFPSVLPKRILFVPGSVWIIIVDFGSSFIV